MPVPSSITNLSPIPGNNSPQGSEIVGPYANDYFQAAFAFIAQLYQGGAVPITPVNANNQKIQNLAPGTAGTDAVNLNQLNTVLGAPQGTRIVFQQAAAPAGWTVDASATFQDCAMRFNSGAGNGGSTPWSSWNYGGTFNDNAHVLTVSEMPSHGHGDAGHGHGFGDPGHNHGFNDPGHAHGLPNVGSAQAGSDNNGCWTACATGYSANRGGQNPTNGSGTGCYLSASGTGCSIGTGYANIQANGGGAGHVHSFTTPQVKFADCVVCIKS